MPKKRYMRIHKSHNGRYYVLDKYRRKKYLKLRDIKSAKDYIKKDDTLASDKEVMKQMMNIPNRFTYNIKPKKAVSEAQKLHFQKQLQANNELFKQTKYGFTMQPRYIPSFYDTTQDYQPRYIDPNPKQNINIPLSSHITSPVDYVLTKLLDSSAKDNQYDPETPIEGILKTFKKEIYKPSPYDQYTLDKKKEEEDDKYQEEIEAENQELANELLKSKVKEIKQDEKEKRREIYATSIKKSKRLKKRSRKAQSSTKKRLAYESDYDEEMKEEDEEPSTADNFYGSRVDRTKSKYFIHDTKDIPDFYITQKGEHLKNINELLAKSVDEMKRFLKDKGLNDGLSKAKKADVSNKVIDWYMKSEGLFSRDGWGDDKHGDGKYSNWRKGLYDSEVEAILRNKTHKFIPVIMSDEIPKLLPYVNNKTKRFAFVINKSPSSSEGTHWVAVFIDVNRGEVDYFDPLAGSPNKRFFKDIKYLINKIDPEIYLKLKINRIKVQSNKSNSCGFFSAKFIYDMFRGKKFPEASQFSRVIDDSIKGEKEIEKFKEFL